MSIDLDFDSSQAALADVVFQFCRDQNVAELARKEAGCFPDVAWRGLAELGVLAAAIPSEGGGALEALAVAEALGGGIFPGPVCETMAATWVLGPEERAAVIEGSARVTMAAAGVELVPWAPGADVIVEADRSAGEVWRVRTLGPIAAVNTLGGEPWGRVARERVERLAGGERAVALFDIAMAGRLAAAGATLVAAAAEHARTRTQFGRPIGEFQAVAHPLADAHMALDGAATLARAAACGLERGADDNTVWAAAALSSARRAALGAVHVGHQVFGAVGITVEGPVFHISRRIRQWASHPVAVAGVQPPDAARRIVEWLTREER